MYKNVTVDTCKMDVSQHAVQRRRHGNQQLVGLMLALACTKWLDLLFTFHLYGVIC